MRNRYHLAGFALVLAWVLVGTACVRDKGKGTPSDVNGQDVSGDVRGDGTGGPDGLGDTVAGELDGQPADQLDTQSDGLLDQQETKPGDGAEGDAEGLDTEDTAGGDATDASDVELPDSLDVADLQDSVDVTPDVGPECGNGVVEGTEECDELDDVEGDGCDTDCTYTRILKVEAAYQRTCVLIEGGRVRCWGQNGHGQLGYGHTQDIGDNEFAAAGGDVGLPVKAVDMTLGDAHTCVLGEDKGVYCWGLNGSGQLGYGNTQSLGDDEFLSGLGQVPVGGAVTKVVAGGSQTCALLDNGKLRCWGAGSGGQLGYGNTNSIGDDEAPSAAGDIPVGVAVTNFAAGIGHTCAIGADGTVRCWGGAYSGQLGYGNTHAIGDDELPSAAGPVPCIPSGLPPTAKATALAAGFVTCAMFDSGQVNCWGGAPAGELGQGNTAMVGDNEYPSQLPPIALGGNAVAVTAGDAHVCALLDNSKGICWGGNQVGQLGYGHTKSIGDDEQPVAAGYLDFDSPIVMLDAGGSHTCAVLANNELRCWGNNGYGELGQGNVDPIGDDELPKTAPAVKVF